MSLHKLEKFPQNILGLFRRLWAKPICDHKPKEKLEDFLASHPEMQKCDFLFKLNVPNYLMRMALSTTGNGLKPVHDNRFTNCQADYTLFLHI